MLSVDVYPVCPPVMVVVVYDCGSSTVTVTVLLPSLGPVIVCSTDPEVVVTVVNTVVGTTCSRVILPSVPVNVRIVATTPLVIVTRVTLNGAGVGTKSTSVTVPLSPVIKVVDGKSPVVEVSVTVVMDDGW